MAGPSMSDGGEWLITIEQLVWRVWRCLTPVRFDERCVCGDDAGEAGSSSGAGAGPKKLIVAVGRTGGAGESDGLQEQLDCQAE